MEYLPLLILFALLFIGYRIEKLHGMLAEWKDEWSSKNNPIEDDDDF